MMWKEHTFCEQTTGTILEDALVEGGRTKGSEPEPCPGVEEQSADPIVKTPHVPVQFENTSSERQSHQPQSIMIPPDGKCAIALY